MIKKLLVVSYSFLFFVFAYYYVNTVKDIDPFIQITWLFIFLILAIIFRLLKWKLKRRKH